MPGTFSQIYFHVVFSVKNREKLLDEEWEVKLYKYISGIIQSQGQKPLIVNGYQDHIHIFTNTKPDINISHLIRDIKRSSSLFVNKESFTKKKFRWQSGYGIFSYSKSSIKSVIKYIENQKEHHSGQNFEDEYVEILNKFDVDFDEKYVFD